MAALGGAAILAVAVAAIFRRGARARRERPTWQGVDLDRAAEWVALRLPAEVGAVLALSDLRRIVQWNHEYFRSRSTAGNGHAPATGVSVVVAGAEAVDWVLARAEAEGRPYSPAQIHAVLAAQVEYLDAIGMLERG